MSARGAERYFRKHGSCLSQPILEKAVVEHIDIAHPKFVEFISMIEAFGEDMLAETTNRARSQKYAKEYVEKH